MRRHAWIAAIASLAVLAAACTAGGQGTKTVVTVNPSASHAPVTITLWTFFSNPEFKEFETAITGFEQKYPWITVKTVPSKDNVAILQAINSGTAPDVAMEGIPDDSAKYCSSNAWIDLNPYVRADHLDLETIVPRGALAYSGYRGVQCALPMLTDAYGLYYNTEMFRKAGISGPPKTYSELFADAKKLTKLAPDGSIEVAGFLPLATGDYELANFVNGIYSGAHWYDASGKSTLASDPGFAGMLTSLKQMTDWFGFTRLSRFFARAGGEDAEFNPSNAFENGKLAMMIDGEWRVGFVKNDGSNVPYATAPFPVADDHPELYGAGQIGGTLVGIPRGTAHTAEAWLLVKYLALDAGTQQGLAEQLHNVPTVQAALADPQLTQDPHFATFLKIFANPSSRYKEITPLGLADVTLYDQFVDRYLAGKVPDLHAGLQKVATAIDKQSQLGG
jgi:multiple sugar transport system substrate-binding protein